MFKDLVNTFGFDSHFFVELNDESLAISHIGLLYLLEAIVSRLIVIEIRCHDYFEERP